MYNSRKRDSYFLKNMYIISKVRIYSNNIQNIQPKSFLLCKNEKWTFKILSLKNIFKRNRKLCEEVR